MITKTEDVKIRSNKILVAACAYTVLQAASIVFTTISYGFSLSWLVECILTAVLCFSLYAAFKSHTKNVMKPLLGAALMLVLIYELERGCTYLQYVDEVISYFSSQTACSIYAVTLIILFFIMLAINVMHYVINASHNYNPKKVRANTILQIAFIVLVIIESLCLIVVMEDTFYKIGCVCGALSDIFIIAIVMFIERTLDEYRKDREAVAGNNSAES